MKKQKHWTDCVLTILTSAALKATSFNVDIHETEDIGRVIELVAGIQIDKMKRELRVSGALL